MDWLIELDRALFGKINLDWSNPVFDWLFPNVTDLHLNPYTLLVVIPLIAYWFFKKRMHGFRWLLIAIVSVGLSDITSFRLVKSSVGRERPEAAGITMLLRTHHHEGPSFPSNHASNIFAAATALSGGLPELAPVFYAIAFLIAYSRVYVGVHFPFDVIVGGLLGVTIAGTVRRVVGPWANRIRSGEGFSHARR